MAAPVGNKFWEARTTHGKKRLFSTPEILWDACCEYFNWNQENPLYETKLVSYQGESTLEDVPKLRAMTLGGLVIFLDITIDTWYRYRKHKDYQLVTRSVEEIIRRQKFEGASAGLFNANIIARDLGLVDRVSQEISDIDKSDIDPIEEMKKRGIPVPELPVEDISEE